MIWIKMFLFIDIHFLGNCSALNNLIFDIKIKCTGMGMILIQTKYVLFESTVFVSSMNHAIFFTNIPISIFTLVTTKN